MCSQFFRQTTLLGTPQDEKFEEAAMDMFQDLLFEMEDEDVSGCEEAALPYEEGSTEVVFQKPDLTPAGVLGWLTGQKHKRRSQSECYF